VSRSRGTGGNSNKKENRTMRKTVWNWVQIVVLALVGLYLWTGCVAFAPSPDPSAGVVSVKIYKLGYGMTEYYLFIDAFLPENITNATEAIYAILDEFENTSIGVIESELESRAEDKLIDYEFDQQQKETITRMLESVVSRLKGYLPTDYAALTPEIIADLKKGIDDALVDHNVIEE